MKWWVGSITTPFLMGTKLKCQSGGKKKRPCGEGINYIVLSYS